MASKYVTDDGLDLDSRYLGINTKAKSAYYTGTASLASTFAPISLYAISEEDFE